MAKRGDITKLIALLAVGGAVGAAAVAFLASRSSQETRAQIREKGLDLVKAIKSKRQKSEKSVNRKRVSNWGNYPEVEVQFYEFEDIKTLRELLAQVDGVIPRGNGRCYGDQALAPQIISTLKYNKFLSFDEQQGILHCQSGVKLSEVLDVVVPQGWFLPVTPGTKLITVGGAIASDVHGKSQHKAGNFSDHLLEIELMLGDGTIVTCSQEQNPELFWTTCGGNGLTGVVLSAKLRLIPVETAYFCQDSIRAENLDEMMDLFEQSEPWPYSVAWLDCLAQGKSMGRGYIMRGDHAKVSDLKTAVQRQSPLVLKPKLQLNVPIYFPSFVLNTYSMKIFNELLFRRHPAGMVQTIQDYNSFFYPLDSILNWNRIYGKRGFTQYQFILPKTESRAGLVEILAKIQESGVAPFLAVLKLYDRQNSYLPFAMKGYALALDFPITDRLFGFLDELDEIVLAHGGRLYLTKDVRMNRDMFQRSYPEADRFIDNIKNLNHGAKFRSFQSDRVGLTS